VAVRALDGLEEQERALRPAGAALGQTDHGVSQMEREVRLGVEVDVVRRVAGEEPGTRVVVARVLHHGRMRAVAPHDRVRQADVDAQECAVAHLEVAVPRAETLTSHPVVGQHERVEDGDRHLLPGPVPAAAGVAEREDVDPRIEVAEHEPAPALEAVGDTEVGQDEPVAEVVDGPRAHHLALPVEKLDRCAGGAGDRDLQDAAPDREGSSRHGGAR
jgi:hypothetical protein